MGTTTAADVQSRGQHVQTTSIDGVAVATAQVGPAQEEWAEFLRHASDHTSMTVNAQKDGLGSEAVPANAVAAFVGGIAENKAGTARAGAALNEVASLHTEVRSASAPMVGAGNTQQDGAQSLLKSSTGMTTTDSVVTHQEADLVVLSPSPSADSKDAVPGVLPPHGADQMTKAAEDPLAALFQPDSATTNQPASAPRPQAEASEASEAPEGWNRTTQGKQTDSIGPTSSFQSEAEALPAGSDALFESDGAQKTTTDNAPVARRYHEASAFTPSQAEAAVMHGAAGLQEMSALAAAELGEVKNTNQTAEERKGKSGQTDSTTSTSNAQEVIASSSNSTHCFEHGSSWEPLGMQDQSVTVERDAAACQHRCFGVPGCIHFSFSKGTRSCHLQDAFAVRKPNSRGFVSGPFKCVDKLSGQESYVDVGHQTYLPRDFRCLRAQVLLVPDLGITNVFPPLQDVITGVKGMNTIRNCQRLCNVTAGCEHFSVLLPAGVCKLAGASAKPLANVAGAISGPRTGCYRTSAVTVTVGDLNAVVVSNAVGMYPLYNKAGAGSLALVALLMVASTITASVICVHRRLYGRIKETDEDFPGNIDEASQGLLLV